MVKEIYLLEDGLRIQIQSYTLPLFKNIEDRQIFDFSGINIPPLQHCWTLNPVPKNILGALEEDS